MLTSFQKGLVGVGVGIVVGGEGGELRLAMLAMLCKEVGLVICYFGFRGVGASSRRRA